MKQVSFSVSPNQVKKFKSLVDPTLQSKVLRNYILNEYELPEDLSIINKGDKQGLKPEKFHFNEYADERVNELVKQVRSSGYVANRSSLMRHALNQLIEKLTTDNGESVYPADREVRHLNFYFEKGTKDVLSEVVTLKDRNATIERFILQEYKPNDHTGEALDKPLEAEQMRVSIDSEAIEKLDKYVDEIKSNSKEEIKGVNRTALMRDVVNQLINKLSHADARKLVAKKRLDRALDQYEEAFGYKVLREHLTQYIDKNDKK
ncbi:hypothetical protein [Priestia endophytica]|uniref:Uncharacterized protein n=1 Tax=Priestia endophytica DSM 13796 TaxID=1121089 RepID=A0A1I6C0F2_9BACI|nr:hypothetical protein [Priestia endophytica]SFQ86565.1 hypothetical protein SAMN02745910_04669 [Priestia endophytica DSM 13796]